MRHLPSFSALRAFESAAKLGSFKQAAEALNLSTSAISHQIRALEREIGESLFERHGNGVVMTNAAKQYLKVVGSAFDQLEKGTQSIQRKHHKGTLQISLLSSLSTLWLIPQLDNFNQKYPGINIELIDNAELIDFTSSRIDAAIRYDFSGTGEWPGLVAHPLIEECIFPVCSPAYLKKHPDVVQLDWKPEHTLLINSRHEDEWDSWVNQLEVEAGSRARAHQTVLDTSNMTLMAAKNGLGVALGRTPFLDQYLENSELVRIHHGIQRRGYRHFLVYPPNSANNADLIQFRDWIVSSAKRCNVKYESM